MKLCLTPKGKNSTLAVILFVWLGVIQARVSYHFGGVVLVGIGYLLLAWVLYPWKIQFATDDTYLLTAIKCLFLFACVYILGTEVFQRYTRVVKLGPLQIGVESFHMIKSLPLWLSFLLIHGLDKNEYKYEQTLVFLLIVDMILTMRALQAIPNFTKSLAAGIVSDAVLTYKIGGAMGYELAYSMVLIMPLMFVSARKNKSLLMWIAVSISVIYVYQSSFMIALLSLAVNVCLSCVLSIKQLVIRRATAIIVMVVFVYLLVEQQLIGETLFALSNKVEIVELKLRLEQMSEAFLNNDTSGASLNRLDLYMHDIQGIIRNPIFGSYIEDPSFHMSAHSTILGVWSAFGLAGIVPFLLMVYYTYRYAVRRIISKSLRGIIASAYLSFIFMAIFNPVFADPHVVACVLWIIPLLAGNLKEEQEA